MKVSAILSAVSAVTLVSAGVLHTPLHNGIRTVPRGYIIEYNDEFRYDHMIQSFGTNSVNYEVRNSYSIFNGAAVDVTSAHDGQAIASMPFVKNVWPIVLHSIPKVTVSNVNPSGISVHEMTGMDVVHSQYNLTGRGIKVGVIDTGLDYKHPAFASNGAAVGCFANNGENCRTVVGWDFVGDAYDGSNSPVPDADPMDCNGHGTHVAGIIGGNALNITHPAPPVPFIGVAPEVTFGAYRVFGCEGSATTDVIMSAMERAFVDGMDVINMSLGGGSAYKSNPEAALGDKLIARGMALAAAAGNDGADGVWMVSDTSLGDLSSSVASFDNLFSNYYSVTYDNKTYPYSFSQSYGQAINSTGDTLVPIYDKNGTLSDGCDPSVYDGLNVKGKFVLTYGSVANCKSGIKGTNGEKAGAAGMLIQTEGSGIAALGGNPGFPMGSISFAAGNDIITSYKKNPNNELSWSDGESIFPIEHGGSPSDFSSYGVDGDLRSKPDIAGPGGYILSTYPLKLGGYAVLSGTSMATPYIAGSHAIYMQHKGGRVPGEKIRQVFKNTATIYQNNVTFAVPSNNTSNETLSTTYASAVKQGAGLINVLRAITTTASITPDHINLLDTTNFVSNFTITITNTGNETESYILSHIATDALDSYPNNNSFPLAKPDVHPYHATVKFTQPTVNLTAGASVNVTLQFTEPADGDASHFPLYSGYVVATPTVSNSSVAVSIPYIGLKGNVSEVPIMDTDGGFPIVESVDINSGNTSSLSHITVVNGVRTYAFDFNSTRPIIQTRLGSHSPSLEIRVYDLEDTFLGYVNSFDKNAVGPIGRNRNINEISGGLDITNWIWDAKVVKSSNVTETTQLPSGEYKFVVATQRKFTPGNYPQDYEVYNIGNIKF
ncbi:hypothetical protein BGZ76_001647 [Entomortierella beljakovae]|nr:hypothetical protein BGZ76_001647 [Entomortierella beljakovae]